VSEVASSVPIASRALGAHRPGWSRPRTWLGPLRWLATAAGIAGGVVLQGLRPLSWRRPARAEFLRFMDLAGVQNLPAGAVAGLLVGISLVAQALYWLNRLGEEQLVSTVIAVILIREIAPLVVGLLAIGRGGLLILDELGEMQRNSQCRALDAQGVDPFLALIMPRVLALAISVFCLTIIFIVVAFATGYAMAALLDVARRSPVEFVSETFRMIGAAGLVMIPVKTLGIGLSIGVVCCLTAMERRRAAMPERGQLPTGFMRSVLAVLLVSGLVSML
jgi:phospholipid/cholesterol/gamma-HCH transport system permease protein